MAKKERTCLSCDMLIVGRGGSKYCSDACKHDDKRPGKKSEYVRRLTDGFRLMSDDFGDEDDDYLIP